MELCDFVTIPNVKLFSVGRWPTWPDECDITEADLHAAVEAQYLPGYQSPRIKLGHTDDRFNDGNFGHDGQPTFGMVKNIRMSDTGMDIYGDLVGVPEWLATIAPHAFPQRSVEVKQNVPDDLTGRNQRLRVDALAFLGEQLPAVSTLGDLQMLFSKKGPELVDPSADIVSDKEGSDPIPVLNIAASASMGTNIEDVRQAFYARPETSQTSWIRTVNVNPNELIVEDESDQKLYSVKFSFNADGKPQFGARKQVRVVYENHEDENDPAVLIAASVRASEGEPLVVYSTRAASRPTKEEPVANLKAIAKHLGLPEDSTEEAILGALPNIEALQAATVAADAASKLEADKAKAEAKEAEEAEAKVEEVIEAPVAEVAVEEPVAEAAVVAEPVAPVAFQVPEGMKLVDSDMLDSLISAASQSTEAQAAEYIEAGVAAGKYPPSKRGFYAGLYRDNPVTARILIDGMASVLPVGKPVGAATTLPVDDAGIPAVMPDELLARINPKALAKAISLRGQQNG